MEKTNVSRRRFLEGAGIVAAGAALAGLTGCASGGSEEPADPNAEFLPAEWAKETDILVIGLGGTGIAAAITAGDEGLGEVLVVEAAPEGYEGGNTRTSQQVVFSGKSKEGLLEYQKNMNSIYSVPDDRLEAWAEGLMENIEWLEDLGAKPEPTSAYTPEYSDVAGSEHAQCYLCDSTIGYESLWIPLKEKLDDLGTEVMYNARAVELIQNPVTKEVFGAKLEDGSCIKARKGVLLACGGFEWDETLMDNNFPIGCKGLLCLGTPYNRGDGIKMAVKAGANLWHMNTFATAGYGFKVPFVDPNGQELTITASFNFKSKDYIYVGAQGNRYMLEELADFTKHGKMNYNGSYVQAAEGWPAYAIFGQAAFDAGVYQDFGGKPMCVWGNTMGVYEGTQAYLDKGIISKGDTIEELADKLGIPAANLAATIEKYNGYCAAGKDLDFGRGEDQYLNFKMVSNDTAATDQSAAPAIPAFDLVPIEGPFYGVIMQRAAANTQGGPERGADQGVLQIDGTPIPRLYAGGECGAIYPYMYNGGGNVAEALASGRIAARAIGALEPWEKTE